MTSNSSHVCLYPVSILALYSPVLSLLFYWQSFVVLLLHSIFVTRGALPTKCPFLLFTKFIPPAYPGGQHNNLNIMDVIGR